MTLSLQQSSRNTTGAPGTAAAAPRGAGGFSLVELTIVLLIVGILLGGILMSVTAQMELRNTAETQKYLEEIRDALVGFAIANDRLPCPASETSNGVASPEIGGACTNNYNGFVPAATLGLQPVNNQGYAIDAWGNRLRYAVTTANSNAFTTTNGMKTTGLSALAPNLLVCSTATGISGSSCGPNASLTSSPGVPIVIYATGKNGGNGTGSDEAANTDGTNRTFVSHAPSPGTAPNGEFDDIVIWLSPHALYNRIVAAGKLP